MAIPVAGLVIAAGSAAYSYHTSEEQKRTTEQTTDRAKQKAVTDAKTLADKNTLDDAKNAQAAQAQAANQARLDASAAAKASIDIDRQKRKLTGGRPQSLLTGPLGLPGESATSGKTLIGL